MPVAARPSVLAGCGNVVTRRKIFKDFDIGDQPRAGKNTLQQVVAENRAFRDTARKRRLEGIHIVNALAAVGALLEQVLINVGHGRCVWVDAGRAREHALIQRAIARGGKRWRHPGLQHAISLDHTAKHEVKFWPVERVRHFPDQALGSSNGKPRVGVQGDDVTNARRHERWSAANRQEGGVGGAAQEPVELMQLSAFALPSDPLALALVPDPSAMQQEKTRPVRCGSVPGIEAIDSLDRRTQ